MIHVYHTKRSFPNDYRFNHIHPRHTLWRFALPMFVSVMFQQFYNLADSMIAGRFAGEDALAAVGASYPITVIFMAFAVGSNLGASVVVSRLFGAKDFRRMKSAVSTAFLSAGILSLALTLSGWFFCEPLMALIHTPGNIFADGALYLKIYIYGLVFLFLYNVCTGILPPWATPKRPLFSDGFLCGKYHFGLHIRRLVFHGGGRSSLGYLYRPGHLGAFSPDRPDETAKVCAIGGALSPLVPALLAQIAAIAIPSILQQSTLSIGNLFVQEVVNRFGSATVAGYSAAVKMNTFAINCFMAFGSCLSSYTAQNLGAKKPERLSLGFREGVRLCMIAAVPFFMGYFFLGRQIMGLFLTGESREAIRCGVEFLRILGPMYFMISVKLMTDGIIRGSGAMAYFVAATIPDLVLRILFANILTRYFGSTGIWMAWPFGGWRLRG